MRRVAIVGVDTNIIREDLVKHGFSIDKMKPDLVVSFGGDGSALFAEQLYPGIPRLTIKHSRLCKKCSVDEGHDLSRILDKLKAGEYDIVEEMKLEGFANEFEKEKLVALNEINVSHALPIKAIRFDVSIDGRSFKDLIGDGIVIATPYGSTGYYNSITGRRFSKGIGLAFNNTKSMDTGDRMGYKHANPDSEINVVVTRGPAMLCADNNTSMIPLKDGNSVTVRKSKETAKIIKVKGEESKISI